MYQKNISDKTRQYSENCNKSIDVGLEIVLETMITNLLIATVFPRYLPLYTLPNEPLPIGS